MPPVHADVCAEWSWGGYPYDLATVPGMVTRSSNAHWEKYMSDVVLNVTREFRDFFADRGGPIILGQVENELHTLDREYVDWCGELAVKSKMVILSRFVAVRLANPKSITIAAGIPIAWGMCNGNSSTKTINTCNVK